MDALTSITAAIGLGKKALELSSNLANQEVRKIVYEVTEQLLQVKSDFLEMKSELLELKEANAALTAENKKLSSPPEMVFEGRFYFRQDDAEKTQRYCPYCYDNRKKTVRIISLYGNEQKNHGHTKCPECKNYFG